MDETPRVFVRLEGYQAEMIIDLLTRQLETERARTSTLRQEALHDLNFKDKQIEQLEEALDRCKKVVE